MLRQAVTVVGLYATVVAPTSFQSTHSLLWGDGYSYEDSIYLNGSLHGGVDVQATTQPPPWQEAGLAQLRVGSRGAVVAGVTTEGKFIYYVQSWVQSEVGEGLTAAHYAYIVEGVAGATSLAVSNEGGIVAVGTEDRHVHVFVCEAGKRPTLLFKISVDRDVSGSTTGRMTWSGVTPPTGPIRDVSLSGAGNVLAIAHDWFVSVFTLRCVAQPSAQLYPKKPLYGFTESFQGRDGTASVVTNLHLSPSHTDVAVYTHDGAVHVVPLAASAPESVADSLGCDVAYYNEGSDYVLHSGVARNCGEVCRETRDCTGYQYSGEVCLLWLNENCHSEGAAGLERQPGSGRTTWLQLAFSYHATAVLRGSTATQAFSATCRPGTPYSADCADNVGTPPPLSQRADLAFTTPSRNVGQPRTAGAVLNILSRMSSRMYAVRVRPDFTTSYHELTARATHPVLALSGASSVSEVWTVQHITTEETTNTLRVIVAIQAYTVGEQDAVQNYTQHFPDAGEEVVFTFDTTNFVATTTRYLDDATASIPLVSMAATLDTYIKGSAEPCSIALHAEDSAGAFEWRTPGVPTSCPRQSPVVGGGGESYAERYRARDIYQVNETWCTAVPRLRYSDRQRFPAELYCVPPMPPIGEGYVCIDHARGLDGSDFCDVGLECFVPAGSRLGRCQAPHSTHIAAHIASTTHASSIAVAVTINGKHHAIKLFSALRDPIPHVPQASTMPCSSEHHNVSMTHLCRNGKQCKGVRCCNDEGGVLRCPPQQPELCGAFVCSDHCEASGSGLPYQCHTAFAYDKVTNYDMTHEHLTYGTTRGIQCPPGMTPIDTQTGCQTAHRLLLLGLPYNLTASHSAQEAMNLPMCYYAEQPLGVHYNMRGTTGPLVERWRGGVVQPLCMSTQYVRLAPSVSCDTVRLPQQPLYPIRSAATCREAVATLNTYNAESLSARSMRYYESSVGSLYPVGCYERLGGVSFKADARTATHPAPQEGMHAICSLKVCGLAYTFGKLVFFSLFFFLRCC